MKNHTLFSIRVLLVGLLNSPAASGASVILDSFSDGYFRLHDSGATSNESPISSSIVTDRGASGVGIGQWSAAVIASSDILTYSIVDGSPSPGRYYLGIGYTHASGSFSLLGYDAFEFSIARVVGAGFVEMAIGASLPSERVRIAFDSPGVLIYPFSDLNNTNSLEDVTLLSFRIIPDSTEFSVTMDYLAVIPEPSMGALLTIGFALAGKRRRN
jgi:hypothetical protein